MDLHVERVPAQPRVAPGLGDRGAERHAARGGEQLAPRRDPVRTQLGGLEQLALGDVEPLPEHAPLLLGDVHGTGGGARLPAPLDVPRTGYQQGQGAVLLVLLDGEADPVLQPVDVRELTEDLVVTAQVERGQRLLDALPVARVGRLHGRQHPPVAEGAQRVHAVLPPGDRKGVRIRPRSLLAPAEQLAEHAAPSPGPA